MFWFLFFLAISIWAFGLKGTVQIALITGISFIAVLFLLVAFG